MTSADVIIVGSGLAAWIVARNVATNKKVVMITKNTIKDSNSILAQGGIAVPISENDDWKSHLEDTLCAGNFLNDKSVSEDIIKNSLYEISKLIDEGMQFDKDKHGNFKLGLEGAHSSRRILHAGGDATGLSIMEFLFASKPDNLTVIEHMTVMDLIVSDNICRGVVAKGPNNKVEEFYANHIVIATGGIGSIFSFTSNDETATGDGLAMSLRSGVEAKDLEFIQFHPTLLFNESSVIGLVSEAVRGEGAFIVDENNNELMIGVHPLKNLAPRDVVSREIYKNIKLGKKVFLNINEVENFNEKFPTITKMLEENNIDYSSGLLRIVPGAHFHMGGLKTNLYSQTNIERLYAVGEVACTGFHGANRLASNSLLECIVQGARLGKFISDFKDEAISLVEINNSQDSISIDKLPTYCEVRNKLMQNLGIIRDANELSSFIEWIESYEPFKNYSYETSLDAWKIINILQVAYYIANAANSRKESIGAHWIEDSQFLSEIKNLEVTHTR